MKMTFLLALCALLLPLSAANASAIRQCWIDAEVLSITETTTQSETRITLSLKAISVRDTGHDAGPCQEVGEVFTFEPDNAQDVLSAKITKGDHIHVVEFSVFSLQPDGFKASHDNRFMKKLEAPKKKSTPKKKPTKKKTT